MLKTMLLAAAAAIPFPMLRRPSGVGQIQPAFYPVEPRFDAVDAVVDHGDARLDRRRAHLQVGHVGGDAVELLVDAAQVAQNHAVGLVGHGHSIAPNSGNRKATRQRRLVSPHEAVTGFLVWLRDNDFSGWHTAADIEEFYRWYCQEEGVEEMPEMAMRERFAALPGVDKVRRRIQHSTEKQLVRIRRRIEADESQVQKKPVLYRIASHEEAAEALAKNRPNRSAKPIRKSDKSSPATVPAPTRRAA